MKEIKIFLASSEELAEDRIRIGDFISNKLNAIYEPRGVRVRLSKWEDMDDAYTGERTQDMYNRSVCDSDIFVALFYRRAGKYTLEEVHEAYKSLRERNRPRICVYIKYLADASEQTAELADFKNRLLNDIQHFTAPDYKHIDSLFLNIVMQVQRIENSAVKLEADNGQVMLDGQQIANLQNVPFAANNEQLKDLKNQLEQCEKTIVALEPVLAMGPNPAIETLISQHKKTRYELKEKIKGQENALLGTALTISSLLGKSTSERLYKAITLFESGDNKGADALLDMADIEREAELNIGLVQAGKEAYQAAVSNIEELRLKAKNVLTIYDNPSRFDEADHAYSVALDTAHKIELPHKDLIDLLDEYHYFLRTYARFDRIQDIGKEWLKLAIVEYGEESQETAWAYNDNGEAYCYLGNYAKAVKFTEKALIIRKTIYRENHRDLAVSYNNLGVLKNYLGDYVKALDFHKKALCIRESVLGKDHLHTALSYDNIGSAYNGREEYDRALAFHQKALDIKERILGVDSPETALSYDYIGSAYNGREEYDKALNFYKKALCIFERVLEVDHPDTATTYSHIGGVYHSLGDYDKALEYCQKALNIRERVLGKNHPKTANSYKNIAMVYFNRGDYSKALEWNKQYNSLCPNDIDAIIIIALSNRHLGDFEESLEWYKKGLDIDSKNLTILNNIAFTYNQLGGYHKAIEYAKAAIDIDSNFPNPYRQIGIAYEQLGNLTKAKEYFVKGAELGDEKSQQWLNEHRS